MADMPLAERFQSILFPSGAYPLGGTEAPDCFHDLSLDQVVASMTAGRDAYNLAPFFHVRLIDLDNITYRQEVMQDLENVKLRQAIETFAERMRGVRERLALSTTVYVALEKQRWQLAAGELYVTAVQHLIDDLPDAMIRSRGLRSFRATLFEYLRSDTFLTLADDSRRAASMLASVRYALLIDDDSVTVRRPEESDDYSAVVEATFRKFQQGAAQDYRVAFRNEPGMGHVEGEVLKRVALLFPDAFSSLARFCDAHATFLAPLVESFDREIQFYVAVLEHFHRLRQAELPYCYPTLSGRDKHLTAQAVYDLALANTLLKNGEQIIPNDFFLTGAERVLVVTGPNQGGKTTFARTVGQLHYLASLGCPVPGTEARLFLCDRIFTHFERAESIATERGKLEDDLVRIHDILSQATARSLLILNEIFSSTSLDDALFLSREVLMRIAQLDALGVCVTFLDELTRFNEQMVGMVSVVDPNDPTRRTFKLERRPADGLAYALAIAEKHRVTYRQLKERLPP